MFRENVSTNRVAAASGGTWYVELKNNVAYVRDSSDTVLMIADSLGGSPNGFGIRHNSSGISIRLKIVKFINGLQTEMFATATNNVKIAIKWNGTNADVFVNGVKQFSATAFTTTNMEFFNGNGSQLPIFIQAMALYPTPLSDADCTLITT